jgi:hypothetical protein
MPSSRPDHEVEQSVQETVRKVAEETGRAGRMMADVGENAVQAQAEIAQRNADALQQVLLSHNELAARLTSRSADQFARALGMGGDGAEAAMQQSTRNLSAVVRSSAMLSHGAQTITTQWLDFLRAQTEQAMGHLDALMRCRTPQEFAAVQSSCLRDQINGIIETTQRAADLSAQAANEAARTMREAGEAAKRAA